MRNLLFEVHFYRPADIYLHHIDCTMFRAVLITLYKSGKMYWINDTQKIVGTLRTSTPPVMEFS